MSDRLEPRVAVLIGHAAGTHDDQAWPENVLETGGGSRATRVSRHVRICWNGLETIKLGWQVCSRCLRVQGIG